MGGESVFWDQTLYGAVDMERRPDVRRNLREPKWAVSVKGCRRIWMQCLVVCFLVCGLSGCTLWSAVPVTLKEVKDYVVGQEQSFSHPLNRVLAATVFCLKKSGFTAVRIEHFNNKGLVRGDWGEASVKLTMEAITPGMTKVSSKVHRGEASREFSSETEIFTQTRRTLSSQTTLHWDKLVYGMVTVHAEPQESSPVIAYLGFGATASVISESDGWSRIALMDQGAGYVLSRHLGLEE